jgi:hypothetical protein
VQESNPLQTSGRHNYAKEPDFTVRPDRD